MLTFYGSNLDFIEQKIAFNAYKNSKIKLHLKMIIPTY